MSTPPIAVPSAPSAVPAVDSPLKRFSFRGTPAKALEMVQKSTLAAEDIAALVAKLERLNPMPEIVRVDFHVHPHAGGTNFTGTILPL